MLRAEGNSLGCLVRGRHGAFPDHAEHGGVGFEQPACGYRSRPVAAVEVLARVAAGLQRIEVGPLRIGKAEDRREATGIAARIARAGSELRVVAGEGVPGDVVEKVLHRCRLHAQARRWGLCCARCNIAQRHASSTLAHLPGVSRADGPGQHPAGALRHPQRHLHRADAGNAGARIGGGHVPDRVLLRLAGDRHRRRGIGPDRPGLGRAGAGQGQDHCRHRPDPGRLDRVGSRRVRQPVRAADAARARHAARCARRCDRLCPRDDAHDAAAAGVRAADAVAAGSERHHDAALRAAAVHGHGPAAHPGTDSRLGGAASAGRAERCGGGARVVHRCAGLPRLAPQAQARIRSRPTASC